LGICEDADRQEKLSKVGNGDGEQFLWRGKEWRSTPALPH